MKLIFLNPIFYVRQHWCIGIQKIIYVQKVIMTAHHSNNTRSSLIVRHISTFFIPLRRITFIVEARSVHMGSLLDVCWIQTRSLIFLKIKYGSSQNLSDFGHQPLLLCCCKNHTKSLSIKVFGVFWGNYSLLLRINELSVVCLVDLHQILVELFNQIEILFFLHKNH